MLDEQLHRSNSVKPSTLSCNIVRIWSSLVRPKKGGFPLTEEPGKRSGLMNFALHHLFQPPLQRGQRENIYFHDFNSVK